MILWPINYSRDWSLRAVFNLKNHQTNCKNSEILDKFLFRRTSIVILCQQTIFPLKNTVKEYLGSHLSWIFPTILTFPAIMLGRSRRLGCLDIFSVVRRGRVRKRNHDFIRQVIGNESFRWWGMSRPVPLAQCVVREWPGPPKYYSRECTQTSHIARAKHKWVWDQRCQRAFQISWRSVVLQLENVTFLQPRVEHYWDSFLKSYCPEAKG